MTLWAIVPVKPLRRGNSRLSSVLSLEERIELNRYLLKNTIEVLNESPQISQVLVISRDQSALAIARELGARTVLENGSPNVNDSIQRATLIAKSYTTRGILILSADLPLITSEDIREMLSLSGDPPVVVVAPDRMMKGTNALLICPAGIIDYESGPDSFSRHCEKAEAIGARVEVCDLPSLALDLDLPEDLELLFEELRLDFTT